MPDITQEEILKKYEELPEDLKTAMYSASTADIIYEIGKKHGLNIEETGNLTTEIAKIIIGLNRPKNFISSLIEILDIQREKAIEIAQDANHRIFFPIREELKKLHGIGTSSELTHSEPNELPKRESAPPPTEEPIVRQSSPLILSGVEESVTPKPTENQKLEELVAARPRDIWDGEKIKKEVNMPPKQDANDKYREPLE